MSSNHYHHYHFWGMTSGQLLHAHLWSSLAMLNIEAKHSTCWEASYYSTNQQSKERTQDNSPWHSASRKSKDRGFSHNWVERKWVVTAVSWNSSVGWPFTWNTHLLLCSVKALEDAKECAKPPLQKWILYPESREQAGWCIVSFGL